MAMPELKASFSSLSPIPWSDVPLDNLPDFLHEAFGHAELLANSVPINTTPPPTNGPAPETPDHANTATKGIDTLKTAHPISLDARNAAVQKAWGKPIKLSAKDNPLNVGVYKTAAHDRHGAWFARRSVHTGLGFTRWRRAISREFLESVKVQKGPGSGAVRGIAGDKRLEKMVVEGVGKVEVWQLSSAFPGPVTPRGFFSLLLTSDNALGEASSADEEPSSKNIPRHFLIISRPTTYEDATPNKDLVYGTYESVELVREIPENHEDPEMNPVEWIMITRSDPGGGIPKFMVERGTPGSIVADVPKFLDWAIKQGDLPELDEAAEDAEIERHVTASEQPAATTEEGSEIASRDVNPAAQSTEQPAHEVISTHDGSSSLLGNLTSAVGATVSGYIPSYFGYHSESANPPGGFPAEDDDLDSASVSSASSSSSDATYASAPEPRSMDGGALRPQSTHSLDSTGTTKPANSHEKELAKLSERRAALDARLEKSREDAARRSQELADKEEAETSKAHDRAEKDRKKAEERHRKEVEKLEDRRVKELKKADEARAKEARRAEERRRKALDKDVLSRTQRERDEARARLDVVERENDVMRAQIEDLQRQNTSLVQKLGATGDAGLDAVRKIKEEAVSRSRTSSRASGSGSSSHKSKESKEISLVGDQA